MLFLAFTSLFLMNAGQKARYNYDYSDPRSVVDSACRMLMNADYEEMISVTDLMEKKRAIATVEAMTNQNEKELLIKEAGKIISYEQIGTEEFTNDLSNQLSVVTIKWTIKNDTPRYIENNPANTMDNGQDVQPKKDIIIYTDYLLKKIDDKWKIISKKSK
jgi:hypothetical protein